MQIVAEKLAEIAMSEKTEINADLFGRSAFNRYYYSSYLQVRDMLGHIDKAWAHSSHKSIPDILTGSFSKLIKKTTKDQYKVGLLNLTDSEQYKTRAIKASAEIADILITAYSIRIDADYFPDKKIKIEKGTLYLSNQSLSCAKNWLSRVSFLKGEVLHVCRQLGIY